MSKRDNRGPAEEELERLYLQPPERFIRARDELARSLRERGERDAAGGVKKLRRPSQAAWLVNQVALREPAAIEELIDAGKRLREAEEAVLAGKQDRDELKAAAGEERDSIVRLVGFARKIAESSERKVAPAAFDRVAETLQAASADSELAERVRAGRLDKEARAATVGLTAPPAPASRRRKGGGRAAEQRAERERTRAELDRARRDLERAEARRERAQVEADKQSGRLKQARAELAEAKREAKRLAAEVRRAEAAVSKR